MRQKLFGLLTALCACMAFLCVSASAMEIFVETPDNKTLTLEVESGDSIDNVKAKVQEKWGILPARQQLFYNNRFLPNGRTLADYNIQKGSTLALMTKTEIEVSKDWELISVIADEAVPVIKLTDDITIDATLNVDRTVTLDLNGHVLRYENGAKKGSVIMVKNNGKLTLIDSDPSSMHMDTELPNGGIITGGTGTYVEKAYYTYCGGGIYVDDGGSFVMLSGNIVGCTASNGGGVFVDKTGEFKMSGGSIAGCTAQKENGMAYGGGVSNYGTTELSGSAEIRNCRVIAVEGDAWGGGICSIHNITIAGNVTVTGCKANGADDAIYIEPNVNDEVMIEGGTFEGAVYLGYGDAVSITGGVFKGKVESSRFIKNGEFYGEVINYGIITGGAFKKSVTNTATQDNTKGKISGGTFENDVTNKGGMITNGTFCGDVTNTATEPEPGEPAFGEIIGGEFWGVVTNKSYSSTYVEASSNTISGGAFHEVVTNHNIITGGTFYAGITNEGGSKVEGHTVTFMNGETEYASQVVTSGGEATAPAALTKPGYRFAGWYNGDAKWDFDTPVTENLTLTAKWEKIHASAPSAPRYDVAVSDGEHGSVTVSPKNASKGSTVTVTVTPDKGYALETLTVTDKNGSALDLTDKGGGRYTFTMPSGPVTVAATFMDDNTMLNFFVDVPAGAYYYDAVLWAAEGGIVTGTDAVHFSPDASCTRAQLVTFLWRASGSPVVNYAMNFTDVDGGAYYAEAVRWAASLGIVGGYGDGRFGTNDFVTREQVAAMLYRFAKAQGMDTTQGGMAAREFDDFESVSPYALEAVDWTVNAGVLKGDNNRLLPQDNCTRAQIVTMLYRALGEK